MLENSLSDFSSKFEFNCIDKYEENINLTNFTPNSESLKNFSFEPYLNEISNKITQGKSDEEIKTIKNSGKEKKPHKTFLNKKRRKKHDKFDKDNIKRKLQVVYLHFLVNFINLIIKILFTKYNEFKDDFQNKEIKAKYQFKHLNYDFAKKINKESFDKLKSENLKNIFTTNTSRKVTYYKNDTVYKNVKKINNKIEKILEQKYLKFFPVFYRKNNFINLNEYDLDIDITLENIQRFEYFKNKELEKIAEPENKDKYAKRLEQSIKDNFMKNSQKFIVKK